MSPPLVSIIIPTYYRNDQLREAIESAKNQDYEDVEIIVVDDSGEGFAREVVEERDVEQYIAFEQNKGDNNARNAGVEKSSGKYIQFLDDDDKLHETKVSKHVHLIENNDDAGVVYCGIEWESRTELPDPEVRGDILKRALTLDTGSCMTSTMLIEREVLLEVMPLKQRPGATDIGTIIDLAQTTQFDYLNEPLVSIGESPDSRGSSIGGAYGREQIIDDYADLYERYDPAIKKEALTNMYSFKGMTLLRDNTWSPTATASFAKACYHSYNTKRLMRVIVSLFGLPGFKIADKVHRKIANDARKRV